MKIVGEVKNLEVDFEDLEEGETFAEAEDDQVQIKTDDKSGCCLASGEMATYRGDEKVVRVDCEVKIL